jgi:hypothetical protein
MSFLGVLLTTSNLCSGQHQTKSLKRLATQLRRLAVSSRCNTILILLSFLTFVAISSPHRVHHLGDAAPPPQRPLYPDHQHEDADYGYDHITPTEPSTPHPPTKHPSQLPACWVLFVLQSMPILGAEQVFISVPLTSQRLERRAPWWSPADDYTNSTPIRAPPSMISLFSTRSI